MIKLNIREEKRIEILPGCVVVVLIRHVGAHCLRQRQAAACHMPLRLVWNWWVMYGVNQLINQKGEKKTKLVVVVGIEFTCKLLQVVDQIRVHRGKEGKRRGAQARHTWWGARRRRRTS